MVEVIADIQSVLANWTEDDLKAKAGWTLVIQGAGSPNIRIAAELPPGTTTHNVTGRVTYLKIPVSSE